MGGVVTILTLAPLAATCIPSPLFSPKMDCIVRDRARGFDLHYTERATHLSVCCVFPESATYAICGSGELKNHTVAVYLTPGSDAPNSYMGKMLGDSFRRVSKKREDELVKKESRYASVVDRDWGSVLTYEEKKHRYICYDLHQDLVVGSPATFFYEYWTADSKQRKQWPTIQIHGQIHDDNGAGEEQPSTDIATNDVTPTTSAPVDDDEPMLNTPESGTESPETEKPNPLMPMFDDTVPGVEYPDGEIDFPEVEMEPAQAEAEPFPVYAIILITLAVLVLVAGVGWILYTIKCREKSPPPQPGSQPLPTFNAMKTNSNILVDMPPTASTSNVLNLPTFRRPEKRMKTLVALKQHLEGVKRKNGT